MMQLLKNEQQNGFELYFDEKPKIEILEALKSNGFRWHNVKKCWFAKASEEKQKLIEAITKGEAITTTAAETKGKAENMHGVKVGDVFVMSWGYDQTNVDFFQVVELRGQQKIKIREIAHKVTDRESAGMSEYVRPAIGQFLKNAFFCSSKNGENGNNDGIYKMTQKMGERVYLNMTSYANAYLTNETAEHFTSSWA
jgi:hypothetical protein